LDLLEAQTDNLLVRVGTLGPGFAATVAVLSLLGAMWLPPEHIHAGTTDGRHVEYVHRHFQSHHPGGASSQHVESDDEDAHYLTPAFLKVESEQRFHPDGQCIVLATSLPQVDVSSERRRPSVFGTVHDPPWRESLRLRGPPTPAV